MYKIILYNSLFIKIKQIIILIRRRRRGLFKSSGGGGGLWVGNQSE
jgi:hypothetical protein